MIWMKGRPAESLSGVGSIAFLMAYVLGVTDTDLIVCLGAALGLVPASVTLLVDSGGLRGVLSKIWKGKQPA